MNGQSALEPNPLFMVCLLSVSLNKLLLLQKMVFNEQDVQEDHSLAYGKDYDENTVDYSKEGLAWNKMSALFRYWRRTGSFDYFGTSMGCLV
jgi:hypothetical protein